MPAGPFPPRRPASSSSSNHTAIAARAALCQVCRLEKPSSNSPIRFAASSATVPIPWAVASGKHARFAEETSGAETSGDPDGFEVAGEEQSARTEDVVDIGVVQVAAHVGIEDLHGPLAGRRIVTHDGEGGEVGGALREPQVLKAGPGTVVTLAGRRAAAGWTTVGTGAPGIEVQHGAVAWTDPAVNRKQRLLRGDVGHPLDHWTGAGGKPLAEGTQIGSGLHRFPP